MVREIKFRAWEDISKKIVHWEELTSSQNGLELECLRNGTNLHWMQYTGLKDKNGKDVYEGDIVNCSNGCPHKVIWREATAFVNMGGWDLEGLIPGKYDWIGNMEEVIGNIYENPELLK